MYGLGERERAKDWRSVKVAQNSDKECDRDCE